MLAVVVRLHRTDSRVHALCRYLPPDMVTAYLYRYSLVFIQVFFFQINQNQPWKLYETSIKAAASQRRDSIGGWLRHLLRCVAVRSDAWVMVVLHLDCIKRIVSPNFRSLVFYIICNVDRHYKDRFGIHVNTQTVVTFLHNETYVFAEVPVAYNSHST